MSKQIHLSHEKNSNGFEVNLETDLIYPLY